MADRIALKLTGSPIANPALPSALRPALRGVGPGRSDEFLLDGYVKITSAFDVFVVSSLYEGVGRSVTGAMASCRPVVATAVDGVVDVMTHGSTGLLAEPRDPQGLAARVVWLLDHPQDAARMGEQARDLVRTLFAPKRMCTVLDEIYSSLLGCAPLPPPEPAKRLREPDGTSRDRTDDAAAARRVDGRPR